MADEKNKFQLSRHIPRKIQLEVRQRDGFGCVVCGFALYQYEHVDPVFADARTHDTKNIALLCGRCHNSVTRGMLAKSQVKAAMGNPRCRQQGYAEELFRFGDVWPYVHFARVGFGYCKIPILIDGKPLIFIRPPEEKGGPFRLSAYFVDKAGRPSLTIQDNEWRVFSDNWDAEQVANTVTIRDGYSDVRLVMRYEAPHQLHFDRFDLTGAGWRITGNLEDGIVARSLDGLDTRVLADFTIVPGDKDRHGLGLVFGKRGVYI